ncbi:MAG TPA: VanZ family protein [Candidatus Gemmiger excrementigallinarum]|uniref:VanZ family protein n=1 Tax=Candidatus Gemmiger excrementigallinarum TaxID=2838609 RepID=A0A9D2EPK5_9FIRM|nr:VanZ family protein [uncultured Subdoligranulum sp.]HIZ41549.1 VanZ family protein [Candidatus Gemmiger excrementigallinarum]
MQTQKTNPWLIAFRVIFTIALLACIAYIFRNSLQTGAESSLRSQAVMMKVNETLGRVHLGPLSEHLIRKIAHFLEFAMEGFLLMLCLRVYTAHFVRHMSWPLLIGMGTALMDETIQLFIPNRTSMVTDVWIDMLGVVAGLLVALIILLIVRVVMAFARIKRENRALREEREQLRRAQMEQEHERLARRAAHRAHEAQLGHDEMPADENWEEKEEEQAE